MMNKGHRAGQWGEEIACEYLRNQGYEIIERNWHSRFGEVDIIAREGDTLVFVEVKVRTGPGFGGPEAALNTRKRKRITATARAYLSEVDADLPVRFDFVALIGEKVKLYRDAFQVEGPCSRGC
jgi:putative endonuclease